MRSGKCWRGWWRASRGGWRWWGWAGRRRRGTPARLGRAWCTSTPSSSAATS
uniref:Uncharacterized protein n=1 Tax=Setaria italica TaxID=4555 RepID=K3XUF4_SETIT